jgi:DNA repair protein RadC
MRQCHEDALIAQAAAILQQRVIRMGTLSDPVACAEFLKMRLAGLSHELFYVIYLDTRHRIISSEPAFAGTVDGAEIYPRVIVKQALIHNAAAVICAHNHPSNNAEPSTADRAVTARLKAALALVDVRLLDHFVVTVDACTSLAERGWV